MHQSSTMANEFPYDLLHQLRISIYKEAGIDSYNLDNLSDSTLPTLSHAIAGIDSPSPDDLRCENCRGKLPRGIQSMICIFCGRIRLPEMTPEAVTFKSTVAFRWLLEGLGFDGSEIVKQTIEGTTPSSRLHSSIKDEVSLCDFLDLEMKWPDESETLSK